MFFSGSDALARAYGIADNRTAELSHWDDPTLASLLSGLPEDLVDSVGFSPAQLDRLLTAHAASTDSSAAGSRYTSRIVSPVYTPKSASAPPLGTLMDRTKTTALLTQIEQARFGPRIVRGTL